MDDHFVGFGSAPNQRMINKTQVTDHRSQIIPLPKLNQPNL